MDTQKQYPQHKPGWGQKDFASRQEVAGQLGETVVDVLVGAYSDGPIRERHSKRRALRETNNMQVKRLIFIGFGLIAVGIIAFFKARALSILLLLAGSIAVIVSVYLPVGKPYIGPEPERDA